MSIIDDIKYGLFGIKPPEQEIKKPNTISLTTSSGTLIPLTTELKKLSLFKDEDKYNDAIFSTAKTYSIPYAIAKGLIALESNFNARAYKYESHINDASYGLCQILYKTARGLGYTGDTEGLYDINVNLNYGLKFLANLHTKYPTWGDTIAAYNMGFPRPASQTTQKIKEIYGIPQPDWVYANQPYVNRVMAYATFYQARDINHDYKLASAVLDEIKSKRISDTVKRGIPLTALIGTFIVLTINSK